MKEKTTMDKPEPDFHFKLIPLAFKLMDIFPTRKNILNEVGIKPGIFVEYASKMGEYA